MTYPVEFHPRAVKDMEAIVAITRSRILNRIEEMRDNLRGDIKRLTKSTFEYRLRVGDYRILFEVNGGKIIIYRIRNRREAYR
jgi:mRNA interferase RelE/StbE